MEGLGMLDELTYSILSYMNVFYISLLVLYIYNILYYTWYTMMA